MREIKFRGIDCTGQWVYGDLLQLNDGDVQIGVHGQYIDDGYHFNSSWNKCVNVNEETIGQYTGLKDKNGKEIYEGDIILWRNQKYVVKFLSGMFYASVKEFNKGVYGGFPLWSLVEYHDEPDCGVIVGNIYEYKEEEK